MSKFQIWQRDEYGQGTIIGSVDTIEKALDLAKDRVTDMNVNNALTMDDRERNWEAYLPILSSEVKTQNKSNHFIYGGRGALNKEIIYSISKKSDKIKEISLVDIPKVKVQIYLGDISTARGKKVDWMGCDPARRSIDRLDHPELNGKMMFFVKVI